MEREILTKWFLDSVSEHLSNRKRMRGIQYTVRLGRYANNNMMDIDVDEYCYPDIHRQKPSDRQTILEHVWIEHFYNMIHVYDFNDKLLPGIYQYKFNAKHTRRKWVVIRQDDLEGTS